MKHQEVSPGRKELTWKTRKAAERYARSFDKELAERNIVLVPRETTIEGKTWYYLAKEPTTSLWLLSKKDLEILTQS